MTLIELMVGLVILGVLVSTALVARSRYIAQLARAEHESQAVAAADKLLDSWWDDWEHLPRDAEGSINGDDGKAAFSWRTQSHRANGFDKTVVVSLQVLDARQSQPLCTVEVLVPERQE